MEKSTNRIKDKLKWLWDNFESVIGVTMLLVMLLILTYQVILRQVLKSPTIWAEDVGCYLFIGMSYIGASAACRSGRHIKIDNAPNVFPKALRPYVLLLGSLVWLAICAYVAFNCFQYVTDIYASGRNSPASRIMMWIPYSGMMLGFVFMTIRIVQMEVLPGFKRVFKRKEAGFQ